MKAVAKTLGVTRFNLIDRLQGRTKARPRYHKAQDGERRSPQAKTRREGGVEDPVMVAARPACGYRRITATLSPG